MEGYPDGAKTHFLKENFLLSVDAEEAFRTEVNQSVKKQHSKQVILPRGKIPEENL